MNPRRRRQRSSSVETIAQEGDRDARRRQLRRQRREQQALNLQMFEQYMDNMVDSHLMAQDLVDFQVPNTEYIPPAVRVFDDDPEAEENEMMLREMRELELQADRDVEMRNTFGSKRRLKTKSNKKKTKTKKKNVRNSRIKKR